MRSKLFVIGIFIFGLFSNLRAQEQDLIRISYANPQKYIIKEITVSGIEYLDKNTIISLSGLKEGDEVTIPGDAITNALKKLWKQQLVGDIQIYITKVEGKNISLEIYLKERPRLSKFYLEGIKKGHSKDLREQFGFITGQKISDALIKNTTNKVYDFYEEKGYYGTEVDVTQFQDTALDNHIILKYDVDKGEKLKIKKINFIGVEKVDPKKLRKKMKETKQKKFIRIFKRSKYVKDDYKLDKQKLIAYYNNLGMRDAKIVADSVYKVDDKYLNIDIHIEEGRKYYFRDITWTGNYKYSSDTLSRVLSIKKGDVYNKQLLDTRLNFNPQGLDISSLYMDYGYLFFNVNPVEIAIDGDSIDIEMRIFEGQQATINRVSVSGNTKTNDHVIIRELRTIPGEKFRRSDLIRTQRELSTLGYFDPQSIGINPKPNPQDGTVDVEYTLVEKPSDQLQLSGGWGGAVGFVGSLGLSFNNFSIRNIPKPKSWSPLPTGDGQQLSIRFQANFGFRAYSLGFTEPWLGGKKPISFSVNLSRNEQRRFNNEGTKTGQFSVNAISVSIGKRLKWPDDNFTLRHTLSLLNYDVNNFQINQDCINCSANNLAYTATISRNDLDQPLYPTTGSTISLSGAFTPPYSLFDKSKIDKPLHEGFIEYHKWMFDNSWFFRLTHNRKTGTGFDLGDQKKQHPLVLNLRSHFGFIGSYNSQLGVGPFERFKVGGDGLSGAGSSFYFGTDIIGLRGYGNNTIVGSDGSDGVLYNKFVMELRYPIVMGNAATIYALTFLEGGNNWSQYSNVNPFDIKRSYGMGVRIFMPAFGLIGFDWGNGIDEIEGKPGVNGGQFHFTIGQMLR